MAFISRARRAFTGPFPPCSYLASIRLSSTLTSPSFSLAIILSPLFLVYQTGLSRETTDEQFQEAFYPFGRIVEAKVVRDRATGRSKGFGFVTYTSIEEAEKAREEMNAKFLHGWVIFVDPAKPREYRPPPQRPESGPSETGFRTNKTVGWCGYNST